MAVKQKFTGDVSALERELSKLQSQYQKLFDQMSDGTRKSQKNADNLTRSISKFSAGMQGAVLGAFSFSNAMSLVNKEIERQTRLHDKVYSQSVGLAASQASVRKALGLSSNREEFSSDIKSLQEINRSTSFGNNAALNNAYASVVSAGGRSGAMEIVDFLAPLFRDKPEELAEYAAAAVDVRNASGGKIDSRVAASLIAQGFSNSRLVSLGQVKYGAQAAASGSGYLRGLDPQIATEQLMGGFAELTRLTADKEGSTSSTAMINLARRLSEYDEDGDFLNRLETVQSKVRTGSLSSTDFAKGFEAKSAGVIKEIVENPTGEKAKRFAAAIQNSKGSVDDLERMKSDLVNATPQLSQYNRQQGRQAAEQALAQSDAGVMLAARSEIEKVYNEAIENSSTTSIAGFAADIISYPRSITKSNMSNAGLAREYASELQTRAYAVDIPLVNGGFGGASEAQRFDQQKLFDAASKLESAAYAIERAEKERRSAPRSQNPRLEDAIHNESS